MLGRFSFIFCTRPNTHNKERSLLVCRWHRIFIGCICGHLPSIHFIRLRSGRQDTTWLLGFGVSESKSRWDFPAFCVRCSFDFLVIDVKSFKICSIWRPQRKSDKSHSKRHEPIWTSSSIHAWYLERASRSFTVWLFHLSTDWCGWCYWNGVLVVIYSNTR